jgi:calcium channel MID1
MQFPKLTPLQSRLAACLLTFILLIALYLSISPRHFAYAAELEISLPDQDHNHHRIGEWIPNDIDWGEEDDLSVAQYQAEFAGLDRSIIGRATTALTELKDNLPVSSNVASGQTQYFVFLNSSVWTDLSNAGNGLPPGISNYSGIASAGNVTQSTNSSSRNVYISVSTCTQPGSNSTSSSIIPQLTLYVSTTEANQSPGPENSDNQQSVTLQQGSGQLNVSATGNVYVGVSGPPNSTSTSSQWSFQISASIENFDLFLANANFTFVLDTDSNNALISTLNLTESNDTSVRQKWLDLSSNPPFQLFVFNGSDPSVNGIQNSYCGLSQASASGFKVSSAINARNGGIFPKQEFYIEGLQPGQTYNAFLAYKAANQSDNTPSTFVGGGGQVWNQLSFTTKSGMESFQLS